MAELLPALLIAGVGVLLLVVLLTRLVRPARRFATARRGLSGEVRTARTRLRALASARGSDHPHGVDSR